MATYAVGDLQGCVKPLKRLLRQAGFSWRRDRLWVVGDLVNRGPDSLKVLRYLHRHRSRVTCVLGNHDLHLLAVAQGLRRPARHDTLREVLVAPDRDELLDWLRWRPLLHSDMGCTMVHAGIPHLWSLEQARAHAAEVEAALRGADYRKFLAKMYGGTPRLWRDDLSGYARLRAITNYLTRMRYVYPSGALDLRSKGPAPEPGKPVAPWFARRHESVAETRLIFGHWASLAGEVGGENLHALDTGCVWGGRLSLLCLDSGERHSCDCE